LQYLLGWLVLLLNPIPDGKMSSLNKWQKSFSDVFLKDRPEEYKWSCRKLIKKRDKYKGIRSQRRLKQFMAWLIIDSPMVAWCQS
jgi:hypothetical protein